MFRWEIGSITFSGGQQVALQSGSVLMLIGPNNAGKSRALREIEQSIASPEAPTVVISSVSVVREGTVEGFQQWLKQYYPSRLDREGNPNYRTKGANLPVSRVERAWDRGETLPGAHPFLIHRLGTEERLNIANRVGSINPHQDQPQAYIHVLQADDEVKRKVSKEVKTAFGTDIIINWGAGGQVGFHVGREPQRGAGPDDDRVSEAYLSQLNQLPHLQDEGDGIRSFVGGLLAALCGAHPVLLIDEPEAFLHPPQARRLAAALARTAATLGRQVIIATHSADVVRGALEESGRVSVCRLTRQTTEGADVNNAALLDSDQLVQLWSKPLLRSSAALDGLFHEGVVVCEGDADCRFYEAIVRRMEMQGQIGRTVDLYFIHGGGKGQLGNLARAYRSLETSTAVIADLDLMRNNAEISDVISALGGDFSATDGLFRSVHSALSSRPPITSVKKFVARARTILQDSETSDSLSAENRRELQRLLDNSADWSEAKRLGIRNLRGGALRDAKKLLDDWTAKGLFLVRDGQLECWWPEGPPAKNEWFLSAIKRVMDDKESMPEATEFMAKVCRWFD